MNLQLFGANAKLDLTLVLLITCTSLAASAQQPDHPAHIGRFTSQFVRGGLYLDFDSVPLFKGGVVQVFYSDPRQEDYGSGSTTPICTEDGLPDGGRKYTAQFDNSGTVGAFHAVQLISVHPDGSVTFELRARWDGPHAATLEWNPIRLWSYPLVGAGYVAQTPLGSVSGVIGRQPLDPKYPANSLSPPWTRLIIHSAALGDLNFGAESSDLKIAFDAREDQFLRDLKVIWLGDTSLALAPGQEVTRKVSFSITPLLAAAQPSMDSLHDTTPVQLKVDIRRISNAMEPQIPVFDSTDAEFSPTIIPLPKQAAYSADTVRLGHNVTLYLDNNLYTNAGIRNACVEFLEELKQDTGVNGSISLEQSANSPGIHLCLNNSESMDRGPNIGRSAALPAEGYRLTAAGRCVRISGADLLGAFYGLQTLRQMLGKDDRGRFFYGGAEIVDWPSLAFRGAHVFVGKNALPFHTNLIKTILSRFKLNELVIECEYTRWRSHPELWRENSMDPKDLEQVAALAREHFVEPIPLINTLGHSEWIFKNGVHLDLAEDVNSPHNYDPSNPETYRLVFDIFGETLKLFGKPRYFHIGHDEVKVPSYDQAGKYPARSGNVLKGAGNLFLDDANHLAEWLRERGATVMLWGDMLLNATEGADVPHSTEMTAAFAPSVVEAERRRATLQRDAIICDWRYEPGAEQRNGLELFEAAGHKAIGSAWFQPENILGWARQAVKAHALGTLQTTWAGYDLNESILETELPQFSAYILAAEYGWDGGSPSSDSAQPGIGGQSTPIGASEPEFDAASIFRDAYRSGQSLNKYGRGGGRKPGWYISLRRAANINLFSGGDAGALWSAYPKGLSEESADTVDVMPNTKLQSAFNGVNVRLLGEHPGGIMLRGAASPLRLPIAYGRPADVSYPTAVRLHVNTTAHEICFLQATGYPVDSGTRVATYIIRYADGTSVEIPIRYAYQIRALDDSAGTGYSTSPVAWLGEDGLTLRLFRWTNPKPLQRILSIEFRADHPYAAPVLFGVTGID